MKRTLSDSLWNSLSPFVTPRQAFDRPPKHSFRAILAGILWILVSESQWRRLPDHYPPKSTCHDWLQRWAKDV